MLPALPFKTSTNEQLQVPNTDLHQNETFIINSIDAVDYKNPSPSSKTIPTFPLPVSQLEYCTECLLRLVASVPPRYTKYNKVLSMQIDNSLKEAQAWQTLHDRIENGTASAPDGIENKDFHTFVQYRLLSMLNDIWKLTWAKVAPKCRKFTISTIHSLVDVNRVEHVLNFLSVWRRLIPTEKWFRIQSHYSCNPIHVHNTPRILVPGRLPSDEHAGDLVQIIGPTKQDYHNIRLEFIRKIKETGAFTNQGLMTILSELDCTKSQRARLRLEFGIET